MAGANGHLPWCQGELAGEWCRLERWREPDTSSLAVITPHLDNRYQAIQKTYSSQIFTILGEARKSDFHVDSRIFEILLKI